jgi:membrane protein involved in colicin uptake
MQAEIERLTAENTSLRRDLEIWRRNGGDDLMRAEVERLRSYAESMNALAEERLSEIERLRRLRGELLRATTGPRDDEEIERLRFELRAAQEEIKIADGEIERLRAAISFATEMLEKAGQTAAAAQLRHALEQADHDE